MQVLGCVRVGGVGPPTSALPSRCSSCRALRRVRPARSDSPLMPRHSARSSTLRIAQQHCLVKKGIINFV